MSRKPKYPWGNFGPDDGSHRALRLVEAPQVQPARPEWFSFRAAVVIAMGILTAGVVWGAMVRLQGHVEAQAVRVETPVIMVEAVPAPAVVHERVPREEVALPMAPSVPPQILAEVQRPAVLPEVSVDDLTENPFEVPDTWERAEEPFPEAKEQPPAPKPAKRQSTTRKAPAVASRKPKQSSTRSAPKRIEARVLQRVQPVYPGSARRAGVEGRVVVQAAVGANGRVSSVSVVSSSGSRLLDSAAVSAVKRWSFSPEQYGGQAVPSAVRVPVSFQLR